MVARPVALPAYNAHENAMINFQPVQQALAGYTRGLETAGRSTAQINAANAMQAGDFETAAAETARSGDVPGAMALRRHPGEMRAQADQEQSRLVARMAGRAQEILGITDPARRMSEATNFLSSDPRFATAARAMGLDPASPDPILRAIVGEARGYRNPLEDDRLRAQTEAARAAANKDRVAAGNADLMEVSPAATVFSRSTRQPLFTAPAAPVRAAANQPPSGYRFVDPARPETSPLVAIEGGPATQMPAETAGRLAMMRAALPGVESTRTLYERAWTRGDFARQAAANLPLVGDLAIASGDQGLAQRNIRTAVEAALRVMTGAAAPEQEVTRYAAMFTPGARDSSGSDGSAAQKLDLLTAFMRNAEDLATRGRSITLRDVDAMLGNLQRGGPAPDAATRQTPAPWTSAPPVQGARQAQDGNWYVPDPARPSKYLRVDQ